MALRHRIAGQLPGPCSDAELVKPAQMRAPVVVEFRPGVDMAEVVAQLGASPSVMLDAAVGSGKSTQFPKALAKRVGSLVIHVVPNPLLALDLYNYVVKQSESSGALDVPMERWVKPDQQLPRTGLLFMSSADLISLIAVRGKFDKKSDVTIFLDEAHESDACTYLIRTLGLNLGMTRLIQASATFAGDGFRARETVGTLVEGEFDSSMTPDKWDIGDPKQPWHFGLNRDNLLLFIDSRSQAAALKQAYSDVGFLTYRLESGMTEESFLEAMKALRDKKGPLVVLIADYSFRSGFSFDVGRILDSGAVAYYDPTPGSVRKLSRPMCLCESVQGAGRGGRIRKGKCYYFRPKAEYPAQICELEGVEREAAAYLSRCMGFKPIGLLSSTVMSKEYLPQSMSSTEALNSVYPLTYHVVDSHGRPRTPDLIRSGSRSGDSDEEEVLGAPPPKYVDDLDYKEFIASLDQQDDMPNSGEFLKASGVSAREPASIKFPLGLRSVRNLVDRKDGPLNVSGLTIEDRRYAVSLVVNRYNLLNVEIAAMDVALRAVAVKRSKLSNHVKGEIACVFEERGRLVAERDQLHSSLVVLTHSVFDVRVIRPLSTLISKRVDEYAKLFEASDHSDGESEYGNVISADKFGSSRGHAAIDYEHQEKKYHRRHRRSSGSERVIEFTIPSQGLFGRSTKVELVSKGKDSMRWGLITEKL